MHFFKTVHMWTQPESLPGWQVVCVGGFNSVWYFCVQNIQKMYVRFINTEQKKDVPIRRHFFQN